MKSGTKENKRRGRPLKTPSEPKTEGQRLMIDVPGIDSDVAKKLGCGLAAVGHWRNGRRIPGGSSRRKLDLLFGIPQRAWDVPPGSPLLTPQPDPPHTSTHVGSDADDDDTLTITKSQIDALLTALKGDKLTDSSASKMRDTLAKLLALRIRIERDRDLLEDRVVREHPEWLRLKAAILNALKPYPKAAKAVAEAIR